MFAPIWAALLVSVSAVAQAKFRLQILHSNGSSQVTSHIICSCSKSCNDKIRKLWNDENHPSDTPEIQLVPEVKEFCGQLPNRTDGRCQNWTDTNCQDNNATGHPHETNFFDILRGYKIRWNFSGSVDDHSKTYCTNENFALQLETDGSPTPVHMYDTFLVDFSHQYWIRQPLHFLSKASCFDFGNTTCSFSRKGKKHELHGSCQFGWTITRWDFENWREHITCEFPLMYTHASLKMEADFVSREIILNPQMTDNPGCQWPPWINKNTHPLTKFENGSVQCQISKNEEKVKICMNGKTLSVVSSRLHSRAYYIGTTPMPDIPTSQDPDKEGLGWMVPGMFLLIVALCVLIVLICFYPAIVEMRICTHYHNNWKEEKYQKLTTYAVIDLDRVPKLRIYRSVQENLWGWFQQRDANQQMMVSADNLISVMLIKPRPPNKLKPEVILQIIPEHFVRGKGFLLMQPHMDMQQLRDSRQVIVLRASHHPPQEFCKSRKQTGARGKREYDDLLQEIKSPIAELKGFVFTHKSLEDSAYTTMLQPLTEYTEQLTRLTLALSDSLTEDNTTISLAQ